MKKSTMLMIVATVLMTSCGTLSQLASSGENQKFQDGIYSNAPDFRSRTEKAESKAETESLIAQTKESPVYLFGDKKDVVVVPDNHSATIKFDRELGSTVVTVTENPYDWRNNINPWAYYTPYSIGSSWWWSRHYDPWYWNTWSYTPWRYHGWHGSLHIGLWYDPWYGWWDPWYDWYNPWYGHRWHHHHYCGWYGGWDPYWGHHYWPSHGPGHIGKPGKDKYYGPRHETETRNRVVAKDNRNSVTSGSSGVSSNRRGIGTSSSTGRGTISSGTSSRRPASGAVRNSSTSSSRRSSSSTYRRPSTTSGTMSRGSSSSSQSRSTISRESGTSSHERSSSSYSRSSSGNYNRGSSSSYGRSSGYSGGGGGGYSRGSSGSSGGSSRRR